MTPYSAEVRRLCMWMETCLPSGVGACWDSVFGVPGKRTEKRPSADENSLEAFGSRSTARGSAGAGFVSCAETAQRPAVRLVNRRRANATKRLKGAVPFFVRSGGDYNSRAASQASACPLSPVAALVSGLPRPDLLRRIKQQKDVQEEAVPDPDEQHHFRRREQDGGAERAEAAREQEAGGAGGD